MRLAVRKGFRFLLPVVGLLAGCNSRDSLSSQGPWRPLDARHSYTPYASPWGRPVPEQYPLIISGMGVPLEGSAASPNRVLSGQRWLFGSGGLPADPQPPAPVAAYVQPGQPEPDVLLAPAGPSDQDLAREPSREPPQEQAAVSPPGIFSAPRRASSYAGTWRARDAEGRSCLVHLSSTASLDLYKASISKCANETLRQVNLWRFDGNKVALLTRGTEIARLEGTEASLNGSFSRSGASLQMSR